MKMTMGLKGNSWRIYVGCRIVVFIVSLSALGVTLVILCILVMQFTGFVPIVYSLLDGSKL